MVDYFKYLILNDLAHSLDKDVGFGGRQSGTIVPERERDGPAPPPVPKRGV
jgi:hypothetical protein